MWRSGRRRGAAEAPAATERGRGGRSFCPTRGRAFASGEGRTGRRAFFLRCVPLTAYAPLFRQSIQMAGLVCSLSTDLLSTRTPSLTPACERKQAWAETRVARREQSSGVAFMRFRLSRSRFCKISRAKLAEPKLHQPSATIDPRARTHAPQRANAALRLVLLRRLQPRRANLARQASFSGSSTLAFVRSICSGGRRR